MARSVAREPWSREHLAVSLASPRKITRLLQFANRVSELNWYAIHRKKKEKVKVPARQENSVGPKKVPLMIKDSVWELNRTKWSKKPSPRNFSSSHANKNRGKTVKTVVVHKIRKISSRALKVGLFYSVGFYAKLSQEIDELTCARSFTRYRSYQKCCRVIIICRRIA